MTDTASNAANSQFPPGVDIAAPANAVWLPDAMGGGRWVVPQAGRLSDQDVNRIAYAVVRLLKTEGLTPQAVRDALGE